MSNPVASSGVLEAFCAPIPEDTSEKSLLMRAIIAKNLDASEVESRIALCTAELDFVTPKGKTALDYAIRHRGMPIVRCLLDAKANPLSGKTLITAIRANSMEIVTALFRQAQRNNSAYGEFHLTLQRDTDGCRPLMSAVLQGRADMVDLLIQKKAIVNAMDTEKNSALIYATRIIKDSPIEKKTPISAILYLLLNAKAEINHCNNKGNNALFYAEKYRRISICGQLRAAGAKLPSKVSFDYTKTTCKEVNIDVHEHSSVLVSAWAHQLRMAVTPDNDKHKIMYNPFKRDIEDAVEMAEEIVKELHDEYASKESKQTEEEEDHENAFFSATVIDCLSNIAKEKYSSVYEEFNTEQMQELIKEELTQFNEKKTPYNHKAVSHNFETLTEAVASYYKTQCAKGVSGQEIQRRIERDACLVHYKRMPSDSEYAAYDPVSIIQAIAIYYANHEQEVCESVQRELASSCSADTVKIITQYMTRHPFKQPSHPKELCMVLRHRMVGFTATQVEYEKLQVAIKTLGQPTPLQKNRTLHKRRVSRSS